MSAEQEMTALRVRHAVALLREECETNPNLKRKEYIQSSLMHYKEMLNISNFIIVTALGHVTEITAFYRNGPQVILFS
jgi:hypothetical protein